MTTLVHVCVCTYNVNCQIVDRFDIELSLNSSFSGSFYCTALVLKQSTPLASRLFIYATDKRYIV